VSRPAVVLGVRLAGLALARSLGRAGIPVAGVALDEHDYGLRSRYLTSRIAIRGQDQEEREQRLLAALREIAGAGRAVLVPERDSYLELVLRRWDEIQAVADVPLPPDPEVARRLARKDLLPREAAEAGVPAPATVVPETEDDVGRAPLRPPFLVKPVDSESYAVAFGRKAVLAGDHAEARAAWRSAQAAGFATVLQEYIPDSHARVFSLATYIGQSGEPLGSVVGRKVRQTPPRFGSSTVFEVRFEPRVLELGLQLLQAVEYRGFAHIEFAYDARDDAYKLLEVNARLPIWGGIVLTPRFDLGRVAYDDLCDRPTAPLGVLREEATWVYGPKDAALAVQLALRGELGLRDFVRPYRRRTKVRAVASADDWRPALALARWAGASAAAKLTR
jgi:D-aspartate ligase